MEKRRDPLEGFDWVFKPEAVNQPPDMEDDSFERRFGSGPTMHDLDSIIELEPTFDPEPSLLAQALREHPRIRHAAMRTGLAVGAIIAGVTAAFISHTSVATTEALPQHTSVPQSSASPKHTTTPSEPSSKKPEPTMSLDSPDMTPIGFSYSTASASPTFIPRTIIPIPTVSETVDATSRPPSSAPSPSPSLTATLPSETCTPSVSPSASDSETPSPIDTESPSEPPIDIETTFDQTEMPQASQSPAPDG